jgi:hypothetical protein
LLAAGFYDRVHGMDSFVISPRASLTVEAPRRNSSIPRGNCGKP